MWAATFGMYVTCTSKVRTGAGPWQSLWVRSQRPPPDTTNHRLLFAAVSMRADMPMFQHAAQLLNMPVIGRSARTVYIIMRRRRCCMHIAAARENPAVLTQACQDEHGLPS